MEESFLEKPSKEEIEKIIDSLQCVLTKHNSCAELIDLKDNTAFIFCGGPCKSCDNRCIEEAIKGKFPNLNIVIR